MEVTLKTNMILADGKFHSRGDVLDIEELPDHLRTSDHIIKGKVNINRVMPIDMIEIGDDVYEEEGETPMKELSLSDLEPVPTPVRRKVVRKK